MKNMVHSKKRMLGAAAVAACMILAVMFTACDKDQPTKEAAFKVILPAEANGNSVKLQGTATTFKRGETVTLNVTVAQGWAITSLSLSEGTLSPAFSASGRTYTFAMPDSDVTVTAAWKEVQEYTITVGYDNLDGDGTATTSPSGKQWEDSEVVVTTVPNGTSYALDVVVKRADGTAVPTRKDSQAYTNTVWRFTMPASNVTVTVRFESTANLPYDITYNITPTGAGKVQGPDMFSANQQVSVSLIPGANYKLKGSTVTVSPGDIQAVRDGDTDTWKFMMPSGAATVAVNFAAKQPFDLTVTELDAENDGATAVFSPAPTAGKMLEGTTVTLTVTITNADMKEYKPNDVTFTCDDLDFDLGNPTGNGPYVWTFTMPETAVDVSVALSDKPSHNYSIITTIFDADGNAASQALIDTAELEWTMSKSLAGAGSHSETGKIWERVGVEVSLAFDTEAFNLVPVSDGKDIDIKDEDGADVPFSKVIGSYSYQFTMPEKDITISATLKGRKYYDITITTTEGDGTIELSGTGSGPNEGKAKDGDPVRIKAQGDPGWEYKENTITISGGVTLVPVGTTDNEWTFTMPDSNVTITAGFRESGEMPIYTNGWIKNGVTHLEEALNGSQWTFAEISAGAITIDADVPGTKLTINGEQHDKAIRIKRVTSQGGAQEVGLTLKAAAPIDLKSTSALSFWMKKSGGAAAEPISVAGFGDSATNTVYYLNGFDGNWLIPQMDSWRQVIVPVPDIQEHLLVQNLFILQLFMFSANDDPAHEVYIDEIKFLKGSEVGLQSITLPSTGGSHPVGRELAIANLPLGDNGYQFTYVLKSTPTVKATVISKAGIVKNTCANFVWDNWFSSTYQWSVSNNNASINAGIITMSTANSTFDLTLTYNTVISTPMSFTILDDSIEFIDDFTNLISAYWNILGHNGYQQIQEGVGPNGVNVGRSFAQKQAGNTKFGRNFSTPKNLSSHDDITFWIRPTNGNVVWLDYSFTLYNESSGTTENGTPYTIKFADGTGPVLTGSGTTEDPWVITTPGINGFTNSTYKDTEISGFQQFKIPFSAFTSQPGFDPTAVTGWSILMEKTADDLRMIGGGDALDIDYADIRAIRN